MHERGYLIAANWKMHVPPEGFDTVDSPYRSAEHAEVMVFAPFLYVSACVKAGLITGAQCGHPEDTGAHTGCVSMAMIKHAGCEAVLCGHSERRHELGETDVLVMQQATSALDHGLHPIVCVGETADQRKAGSQHAVVQSQLSMILPLFSRAPRDAQHAALTIAYEPVWAIGTGVNATPDEAEEMHAFIRSLLPEFAKKSARIIYGGSVTGENASSLLSQQNIDGALIGGASLKPEEFRLIVESV